LLGNAVEDPAEANILLADRRIWRRLPQFTKNRSMKSDSARESKVDEDRFNMALRKFLKQVGVTSQREIERLVRDGKIQGKQLKLRMTLTADNTPLQHVVEETIDLH
jgi:hypothetical protein